MRVVLDVRPLQQPERAPTTAIYLGELLRAFDAQPIPGESFALMLQAGLDDPTQSLDGLEIVGRRLLPPTRLLRAGAMTVDPFLLRGASVGAGWRAERSGAAGAVYHAVGGIAPLASGLPVVVTLLDLAAWEAPNIYQRGPAARFGHRLRTRILRDAAAVIVGTEAVGHSTRALVHVRRERIKVVRLAPRGAFKPEARDGGPGEARRLGLPERYVVYPGRDDARQDLATLLRALGDLAATARPSVLPESVPWPPRVLLVGASPDDRAALARAAARQGVGDFLLYAPHLEPGRLASVVADAAGLSAIEALACDTPVLASAVGALPEIVAGGGILVEPHDAPRLAAGLATIWGDDAMHARLVSHARRSDARRRAWRAVADDTRQIYAAAAGSRRRSGSSPTNRVAVRA